MNLHRRLTLEVDWRQLADIWASPQGKALNEYLEYQIKGVMDDLTRETTGLDGIANMLGARAKLSAINKIVEDLKKAEGIAKHNEGSFIAKVLK
jgi:hypothetical protein